MLNDDGIHQLTVESFISFINVFKSKSPVQAYPTVSEIREWFQAAGYLYSDAELIEYSAQARAAIYIEEKKKAEVSEPEADRPEEDQLLDEHVIRDLLNLPLNQKTNLVRSISLDPEELQTKSMIGLAYRHFYQLTHYSNDVFIHQVEEKEHRVVYIEQNEVPIFISWLLRAYIAMKQKQFEDERTASQLDDLDDHPF